MSTVLQICFFIPVGMFAGANITWDQIWLNNLIPVTLGNVIGGAVIVPMVYYWVYLKESIRRKKSIVCRHL